MLIIITLHAANNNAVNHNAANNIVANKLIMVPIAPPPPPVPPPPYWTSKALSCPLAIKIDTILIRGDWAMEEGKPKSTSRV